MQMLTQNPQMFMAMMQQNGQGQGQGSQYNMPSGPQGHNPGYAPNPQPDQSGNPYAPRGDGGGRR